MSDLIDRQAAIDALWKALYEYEDKTETQFQESDELDVGDWILHRIFVQNMNDIDRKVIQELPSAQPEHKRGKWIDDGTELGCCCDSCGITLDEYFTGDLPNITLCKNLKFCPNCGADMRE